MREKGKRARGSRLRLRLTIARDLSSSGDSDFGGGICGVSGPRQRSMSRSCQINLRSGEGAAQTHFVAIYEVGNGSDDFVITGGVLINGLDEIE
jgi:hypothetical protein